MPRRPSSAIQHEAAANRLPPGPQTSQQSGDKPIAAQNPRQAGFPALPRPALLLAVGGGTSLAAQVLAAEALGPVEFGRFALFMQATAILSTVAIFGYDNAVIRKITAIADPDRAEPVARIAETARRATGRLSIVTAAAAALLFMVIANFGLSPLLTATLAIAIPATVRMRLESAILRAIGHPDLAIAGERLFRDIPLMLLTASVLVAGNAWEANATFAALAVVTGVLLGMVSMRPRVPGPPALPRSQGRQLESSVATDPAPRELHRSARRFAAFAVADAAFQRIDIFIVSAILGEHFAGLYGVALIVTAFCGFGAVLSVYVYVPRIGAAYASGRKTEAEALLRASAYVALATTVAVLLVWLAYAVLLSGTVLTDYQDAEAVVALMLVAQFANATTGSAAPALGVLGYERDLIRLYVCGVVMKIVFSTGLVLIFGFIGIGASLVLCYVLMNVALVLIVRRRTSLMPGIFSVLRSS